MRNMRAYMNSLQTIESRAAGLRAGREPTSYTEKLLASQNERVKKLGSEVVELVREDTRPDFDESRLIGEASDTIYSVEVMCAARRISFLEVLDRMQGQIREGWPTQQMATELAENRLARYQSLGAYSARLVAEECNPDFSEEGFVNIAANLVYMTGVILAGRGLTMRPVFNELAARNESAQGVSS